MIFPFLNIVIWIYYELDIRYTFVAEFCHTLSHCLIVNRKIISSNKRHFFLHVARHIQYAYYYLRTNVFVTIIFSKRHQHMKKKPTPLI